MLHTVLITWLASRRIEHCGCQHKTDLPHRLSGEGMQALLPRNSQTKRGAVHTSQTLSTIHSQPENTSRTSIASSSSAAPDVRRTALIM